MKKGQSRKELSQKLAKDIIARSEAMWTEKLNLPEIELAGPLVKA